MYMYKYMYVIPGITMYCTWYLVLSLGGDLFGMIVPVPVASNTIEAGTLEYSSVQTAVPVASTKILVGHPHLLMQRSAKDNRQILQT
jgi:hypothetical protein